MMPARKRKKSQLRLDASLRRDEVVRLAVMGTPGHVIASELGLTVHTISRILNEPEIRARVQTARSTALNDGRADLQAATRWLTSRLLELAASKNRAVAVRAVVEALSKIGFDAPKRIDLGLLAGSTDDELWSKLRELEHKRTARLALHVEPTKPPEVP